MANKMDPLQVEEAEKALAVMVSGFLYGISRQFIQSGASPTNALKYAAAMAIEIGMGPEALTALGLDDSTAHRWRREVRVLAADMPEEPPADMLGEVVSHLIRGL